jgi:hypothetical protein
MVKYVITFGINSYSTLHRFNNKTAAIKKASELKHKLPYIKNIKVKEVKSFN